MTHLWDSNSRFFLLVDVDVNLCAFIFLPPHSFSSLLNHLLHHHRSATALKQSSKSCEISKVSSACQSKWFWITSLQPRPTLKVQIKITGKSPWWRDFFLSSSSIQGEKPLIGFQNFIECWNYDFFLGFKRNEYFLVCKKNLKTK